MTIYGVLKIIIPVSLNPYIHSGPLFTEGSAIQVMYHGMLDTCFIYILDIVAVQWFIKDSTTTRKANSVLELLHDTFVKGFCLTIIQQTSNKNSHATNLAN
jgi:hypothetical protein